MSIQFDPQLAADLTAALKGGGREVTDRDYPDDQLTTARPEAAAFGLYAFRVATTPSGVPDFGNSEEIEIAVEDLLADLRFLCVKVGVDFGAANFRSERRFCEDVDEMAFEAVTTDD